MDTVKREAQPLKEREIKKLGQILLDYGLLSPAQLDLGLEKHRENGTFLGETLVEAGLIRREVWLEALSLQLGLPSIDLRNYSPDESIIRTIPEEISRSRTVIALGYSGSELATAMRFPQNEDAIREIQEKTRRHILPVIGWAADIEKRLDEVYRCSTNEHYRAFYRQSRVASGNEGELFNPTWDPLYIHSRLYLNALKNAIDSIPIEVVQQVIQILFKAYHEERNIFIMGNGGSAATASHFSCDLGKGTAIDEKKRFRVISLTDNIPLLTAWSNDTHYHNAFVEQLKNLLHPGDVVVGISTSGNSPNVLNAVEYANSRGAITIGITGFSGGKLKDKAGVCVIVPSFSVELIEDVHHSLHHLISTHLRRILREEKEID